MPCALGKGGGVSSSCLGLVKRLQLGVPQDPGSLPGHWPAASASRPITPCRSGLGQAARHARPLIGRQALLPCMEAGGPWDFRFSPSQGSFPFLAEASAVVGGVPTAIRPNVAKNLTSASTRGCQLPHTKVPTGSRQREVTRVSQVGLSPVLHTNAFCLTARGPTDRETITADRWRR
jgi:hypothetical protein